MREFICKPIASIQKVKTQMYLYVIFHSPKPKVFTFTKKFFMHTMKSIPLLHY